MGTPCALFYLNWMRCISDYFGYESICEWAHWRTSLRRRGLSAVRPEMSAMVGPCVSTGTVA
jgi:hypothetical protein